MSPPSRAPTPWMDFPAPVFAPLEANARAEVCVVGAGIAGLTVAYLLTRKGKRVLVLDDGPIGSGMTSRTTAHLSTAIDDRYHEVERIHGEDGARLARASHAAAIEAVEAIVHQEAIDCDFFRLDGYLFLPPEEEPDELLEEYRAALRAGVEGLVWVDRAPIEGFDTGRCLRFPRQGQFHPLKYLAGLARAIVRDGGTIHCGTHVEEVSGGATPFVRTAGGLRVDCADVVVATNAPISDRVRIHTKQAPYISYVIAARVPAGSVADALFWDTLDDYHYVRLDRAGGELLIVGGEDHKSGQADDAERRFAALERWMRQRFPQAREIRYRWCGQVMETVDDLAFIGRDPGEEHVYVATGDSGMGMTHGTIAGIVITDLIHGADIPWARLYDPARKSPAALGAYARENANVAWQYTDWIRSGEVDSTEAIAPGSGAVYRRGVHKVAAYREADGTLHEMSAACTHLGCPVHWNTADNTWDCKCHGSRFDAFGEVVSGPAVHALRPVEPPHDDVRNTRQDASPPPTAGL
jgi:glycine/D-amino acid oxidase-like deaminating enzyme/nitrite reductase/ring-hydroxylating ferredoxin subunit